MSLCIYRDKHDGFTRFVDNRQDVLNKIRLGYIRQPAGASRQIPFRTGWEQMIVLLNGSFDVVFEDGTRTNVGPRSDLFTHKAWAVYLPLGMSAKLATTTGFECVIAATRAESVFEPTVITPDMVYEKTVGTGNYERKVYDIAGSEFPADRIIIGETINPPGNWSSFPPHKHDEERGDQEVKLEEAYYFRINPASGFGFQRVYSPKHGIDEAIVVKDHCTVLIPEGYHPVAASPGYTVYYLWVLAGEQRCLCPFDDPDHAWIRKGAL